MSYEYVIKNGFVERREVGVVQTIPLEDFVPAVTTYVPIELAPLPDNTKFIKMAPGQGEDQIRVYLITETPPQKRDILFDRQTFKISLPYERFWFVIDGQKTFSQGRQTVVYNARNWGYLWSKTPMLNLESEATWGHLPNVYPASNVCFGMNNVNAAQAFGHYVNTVMNTFYTSPFNHDLSYDWPYRTMEEWAEASEQNGAVWMHWPLWNDMKPMSQFVSEQGFTPTMPDGPGEVVPAIRPIPTFSNIQNWWNELSEEAQMRFRAVLDG